MAYIRSLYAKGMMYSEVSLEILSGLRIVSGFLSPPLSSWYYGRRDR